MVVICDLLSKRAIDVKKYYNNSSHLYLWVWSKSLARKLLLLFVKGGYMNKLAKMSSIKPLIYVIRGQKVMLDFDLGQIYRVPVKRLNEQVKRNISRFPVDFMFQLTQEEAENLRGQWGTTITLKGRGKLQSHFATANLKSQFATSRWGGARKLPYAFTRNGVNMLAAVLRTEIAIQRSIFIMRAFSVLEEAIGRRKNKYLSSPEVIKELSVHSKAIMRLFQEGKVKDAQIGRIEQLQKEMTKLIQKIIITSIEND